VGSNRIYYAEKVLETEKEIPFGTHYQDNPNVEKSTETVIQAGKKGTEKLFQNDISIQNQMKLYIRVRQVKR